MSLPHILTCRDCSPIREKSDCSDETKGNVWKQEKLQMLHWAKQILEGEEGKERAKATAKQRQARKLCAVFAVITVSRNVLHAML